MPGATEAELAGAAENLLTRAGQGPGGIWLSGPGTPQFSVSGCPDTLAAERRARRLLRRCTAELLTYARV